ncbi:MAG: LamG-like jellyroll fold domain-containing protein [Verrucomicrobiota bacterium]
MKTIRHPLSGRFRSNVICGPVVSVIIAMAGTAWSADVTLNAGPGPGFTGDAIDTSSFAAALNWSNALAPASGNAYIVPTGRSLRTPLNGAANLAFAGDSLAVSGSLVYKSGSVATNINTYTIDNLTLNGGTVNNASNFLSPFILAGNGITVLGAGTSTLLANNATITVSAPIGGSTGILLLSTNTGTAGRQVVLSGVNTYTGNIQVSGLSGALLSSTGKLAFTIGATGVNNTITGAAPFVFDGTFAVDLSAAGDTVGNSWTLVNIATVVETFGSTFSIDGFTENNTVWTSASGKYQFREDTGMLTRIGPDTDGDGLPDAWEEQYFGVGVLDEQPGADSDYDYCSNLLEYRSGTDPADPDSYPDTEVNGLIIGDGLNDGWELTFFGNLTQIPGGDPDADYNTNAEEYAAGSNPNAILSYPDTDFDSLNDGWEKHYFTTIDSTDAVPDGDPDGDLFTNYQELFAITDPEVQISSPDTDGDGLPDGWEVKYFRVAAEDLSSVIVHYGAANDVDGDGYGNLSEYKVGTNPILASSTPSALAYWRFEEKTSGVVPYGNDTGGNQINTVLDSSGLGNHMMTWRNYTAPTYTTVVPFAAVPLTAATNTASLAFVRDAANLYLTDNVYTTGGVGLNSQVFTAFTVESSFRTTATNVWQVVVGKTGNPIGGQAPFSLKIRASDNKLIAGIVDGAGTAKEAISTRAITTGAWFSTVVTASATELKLWIKGASDAHYILEATTSISGAFYTYAGVNAPWVVGLGKWNGFDADPFSGNIDEVRISPKVLAPADFLIPVSGNDFDMDGMDDTWETTTFGGTASLATGDFDGDGTDNLTEYRLGLIANSGSSGFTVTRGAGGLLTWPSVTGVKFDVLRSTTLAAGSWTVISPPAGIDGAAGSTGFTDPAPPVGNAFYRVALRP